MAINICLYITFVQEKTKFAIISKRRTHLFSYCLKQKEMITFKINVATNSKRTNSEIAIIFIFLQVESCSISGRTS